MKIAKDSVVTLDYRLTDDDGDLIDSSQDGPLVYLHGHHQIVPGLEKALSGKAQGDTVKVVVPPAEGYGEKAGGKPIVMSKDQFPPGVELEPGAGLSAATDDGREVTLWVLGIDDEHVTLSLEHPLAGVSLHFDVTVKDVRQATQEELHHGHAHGPDGHGHHHH